MTITLEQAYNVLMLHLYEFVYIRYMSNGRDKTKYYCKDLKGYFEMAETNVVCISLELMCNEITFLITLEG